MINWRFTVLPTINDIKFLKIRSIYYNIVIYDSLPLNRIPFKYNNIAGYCRMDMHIHKETKKSVRGFFFRGNHHRDDDVRQYVQYLNGNKHPRVDGANAEKPDAASLD